MRGACKISPPLFWWKWQVLKKLLIGWVDLKLDAGSLIFVTEPYAAGGTPCTVADCRDYVVMIARFAFLHNIISSLPRFRMTFR